MQKPEQLLQLTHSKFKRALNSVNLATHLTWVPRILGRVSDTPGKQLCMFFLGGMLWAILPRSGPLNSQTVGVTAFALIIVSGFVGAHGWVGPWLMAPAIAWLGYALPFQNWERSAGGDYSYGLYVYGYPIQQLLAYFNFHKFGVMPFFGISLLVSALFAVASWRFIEGPALRLKRVGIFRANSMRTWIASTKAP